MPDEFNSVEKMHVRTIAERKINSAKSNTLNKGNDSLADLTRGEEEGPEEEAAFEVTDSVRVIGKEEVNFVEDSIRKTVSGVKRSKQNALSVQKKKVVRTAKEEAAQKAKRTAASGIRKAEKKAVIRSVEKVGKGTVIKAVSASSSIMLTPVGGAIIKDVMGIKEDIKDVKRVRKDTIKSFLTASMAVSKDKKPDPMNYLKNLLVGKGKFVGKQVLRLGKWMAVSVLVPLLLLFVVVAGPPVILLKVAYSTPLAIFLPDLNGKTSAAQVVSQYSLEFDKKVKEIADKHEKCTKGFIVYQDMESDLQDFNNNMDIILIYSVMYCCNDSSLSDLNQSDKDNIKKVFDSMCSYKTKVVDQDGSKVLHVIVTKKTYKEMIDAGTWTDEQKKWITVLTSDKAINLLKNQDDNGGLNILTLEQKQMLMKNLTSGDPASEAVLFAIDKLGIPYSQPHRDDGKHYDCSSLAYYSYKSQGINLMYHGSNTAADEAHLLAVKKATVKFKDLKPGDLIFYSSNENGRYKNITHVAIYCGNGYSCEASSSKNAVVYRPVWGENQIVMCGRPIKM